MGERKRPFFEPSFNRSIKVQGGDDRLTSDTGMLLLREADQRLGLTPSLSEQLHDPRQQHLVRYLMPELLRERIYSMAQGYRAQDDVDRLAHDPALRMATWDRPGEQVLDERSASQPTHSRLVDIIAHQVGNLEAVRGALCDWVERHLRTQSDHAVRRGTIDIDSFPVEVFGEQAGAAYNGYYEKKMYHPLVASFSVAGDYDSTREGWRLGNGFIHAILRSGNVHTAEGILRFLDRVLELAPQLAYVFDLRLDAGFMIGRVLDYLKPRKVRFLGRLKSNPVLDRLAQPHLKRPPGRPPRGGYETRRGTGNVSSGDVGLPATSVVGRGRPARPEDGPSVHRSRTTSSCSAVGTKRSWMARPAWRTTAGAARSKIVWASSTKRWGPNCRALSSAKTRPRFC